MPRRKGPGVESELFFVQMENILFQRKLSTFFGLFATFWNRFSAAEFFFNAAFTFWLISAICNFSYLYFVYLFFCF